MIQLERTAVVCPVKRNFADAIFAAGKFLEAAGWGDRASLGYRHALGFVVTREEAPMGRLSAADLVFVERWDAVSGTLKIRGAAQPSEEAWIHAAVYQNRSSAIHTLFVSDPKLQEWVMKAKAPSITGKHSRGSPHLFGEVEARLGSGNRIVVPGMGVLSLGCTIEDVMSLLH